MDQNELLKDGRILALKVIADSMISIGMTKYPRNASLIKGAGDEDTAFGYKLKFN